MATWPRDSRSSAPSSDENELPGSSFLSRIKPNATTRAIKATPASFEKRHSHHLHYMALRYAWPSFASTSLPSRPWLSSRSIESADSCSSRIVAVGDRNSGSRTPKITSCQVNYSASRFGWRVGIAVLVCRTEINLRSPWHLPRIEVAGVGCRGARVLEY